VAAKVGITSVGENEGIGVVHRSVECDIPVLDDHVGVMAM
jgi:hypothetical protein